MQIDIRTAPTHKSLPAKFHPPSLRVSDEKNKEKNNTKKTAKQVVAPQSVHVLKFS